MQRKTTDQASLTFPHRDQKSTTDTDRLKPIPSSLNPPSLTLPHLQHRTLIDMKSTEHMRNRKATQEEKWHTHITRHQQTKTYRRPMADIARRETETTTRLSHRQMIDAYMGVQIGDERPAQNIYKARRNLLNTKQARKRSR